MSEDEEKDIQGNVSKLPFFMTMVERQQKVD